MLYLALYTEPADEPVSLDQARLHCRVDGTLEDAYLLSLIRVARRACEQKTGRQLVTQTWDVLYDGFGRAADSRGVIWLPRSPLQSVTHVKYYDTEDVQQTWAAAKYQVVAGLQPRLAPVWTESYPSTYDRMHAVEVRVVVGYGEPDQVPEDLVQWMLLHIGHWYANREAATPREMSALPFVDGLLDRERIVVVG